MIPRIDERLGLVAYTAVLFLVFLALSFPYGVVVERVTATLRAESGWEVEYAAASLVPWDGLRISEVRARPVESGGTGQWIRARRLAIRPSIGSLLGGSLEATTAAAEAYGGRVSVRVTNGDPIELEIDWEAISLETVEELSTLVGGALSGVLSGQMGYSPGEQPEANGELRLRSGAIEGARMMGFPVPDLHFDDGEAAFELRSGRVNLTSVRLRGPELEVDLRGQVFLREPVTRSVINATATLRPNADEAPDLAGALALSRGGTPASSYTYSIYGTLGSPGIR